MDRTQGGGASVPFPLHAPWAQVTLAQSPAHLTPSRLHGHCPPWLLGLLYTLPSPTTRGGACVGTERFKGQCLRVGIMFGGKDDERIKEKKDEMIK